MAARVKPASAPGRISCRDDIWKDIQDWAKPSGRNDDDDQALVIGSQIKDNVTEQRMLESRLFDLSKERYKFIVQVAWQRKAFIDRQKQKTSVMKDLLTGIDTTEIQQSTKKNHGTTFKERIKQYKELVEKTYPPKPKSERNRNNNELFEKKPIFVDRIYKTEPIFSERKSRKSTSPIKRYVSIQSPGKCAFFPAIETQVRDRRMQTAQGRQSVPVNFMRHEKVWTATESKEGTDRSKHRPSISTPIIRPRYLTYRSVYDRRFMTLQNCLTRPYNPNSHGNNDLMNRMEQLNKTFCSLPVRDPPTSDLIKETIVTTKVSD
ncbi:uncharacterized protein LOC117099878 [Anneissia japonica]|uniref:uncharacterized protein LOC117099878 n=1 Tax=Anneissia japonica TaxID=1529436 RepID=UPI001425A785|nr:uncharacterized protein LOC117099878 [Anneissia japonica]XP_033095287.1 uncharacterized protein LOC117099878 [Anneissia japonica]